MAADEIKELKDDWRGGGLPRDTTTTQKGGRMMKMMAKRVLQPTKNVYRLSSSSYPFP